jgi:hypothetical protein
MRTVGSLPGGSGYAAQACASARQTSRREYFDCGREALNRFHIRDALQNQLAGASQTSVTRADDEVAGYYTLIVGQVEYDAAPARLKKGLAHHPAPIMLRTLQAAEIAGIRAFAVHAKDGEGVLRTF